MTRPRWAGPNASVRTGASGLSSLSESPFHGAISTTARASANGANASGGSASICSWDFSSVVTRYTVVLQADAATGLGQLLVGGDRLTGQALGSAAGDRGEPGGVALQQGDPAPVF